MASCVSHRLFFDSLILSSGLLACGFVCLFFQILCSTATAALPETLQDLVNMLLSSKFVRDSQANYCFGSVHFHFKYKATDVLGHLCGVASLYTMYFPTA